MINGIPKREKIALYGGMTWYLISGLLGLGGILNFAQAVILAIPGGLAMAIALVWQNVRHDLEESRQ